MKINQVPIAHDLVLIGGGHSHISVLKYFGMNPIPGLRISLINKNISSPYSGMLPGYISGTYLQNEVEINLPNLCQFSNSRLIVDEIIQLNTVDMSIVLKNRPPIYFDTVSINTGGEPDLKLISGAIKNAIPIKPISNLINQLDKIKLKISNLDNINISIIGAGAGGIEIALSIKNLIANYHKKKKCNISLVSRSKNIIKNHNKTTQMSVLNILEKENINLIIGDPVINIQKDFIKTKSGLKIKSDISILVSSVNPPKWLTSSGLNLFKDGFIAVNRFLQSTNINNAFASGDVASIIEQQLPKSGVYAVRQGPVLANNLHNHILRKPLRSFKGQKHYLSLIGNGKDYAIASWWVFSLKGKWVWKLKSYIDKSFIKKFNTLPIMEVVNNTPHPKLLSKANTGDPSLSKIRCLGCGAKTEWFSLKQAISKTSAQQIKNGILSPLDELDIGSDIGIIKVPNGYELVQSVDLISALISDPYNLSRIACLHAISDIIAAGASPHSAEAIFILPHGLQKSQFRLISELLDGASDVLLKHNMKLTGGHTSEGQELQVGFSVTGFRKEGKCFIGPSVGQKLILTKPLGIGVILAGQMRGKVSGSDYENALKTMLTTNATAGNILKKYDVTAMTDITGFGLARHGLNLTKPYGFEININQLPILSGSIELIKNRIVSSISDSNKRSVNYLGKFNHKNHIVFDPQTGGGLLASIDEKYAGKLLEELLMNNVQASIIGKIIKEPKLELIL